MSSMPVSRPAANAARLIRRLAPILPVILMLSGLTCTRARREEPLVDGYLLKQIYPTGIVSWDRYFEVFDYDFLPQIPTVRLNGMQPEMINFNAIDAAYDDTFPFRVDTTEDLQVKHYWGTASARIHMPGDFTMTGPDSNYVYNRDSLLRITWHKSSGATSYDLNLYLDYEFVDWNNEWDSYEFDRVTIVYDTFCEYVRNQFFPSHVQRILDGEAEAVVYATDGPEVIPGATGNIQGDGFGYYSASNQPREAYFVIVEPPAKSMDRALPIQRSRERLIQRLRRATGIPDSVAGPRSRLQSR